MGLGAAGRCLLAGTVLTWRWRRVGVLPPGPGGEPAAGWLPAPVWTLGQPSGRTDGLAALAPRTRSLLSAWRPPTPALGPLSRRTRCPGGPRVAVARGCDRPVLRRLHPVDSARLQSLSRRSHPWQRTARAPPLLLRRRCNEPPSPQTPSGNLGMFGSSGAAQARTTQQPPPPPAQPLSSSQPSLRAQVPQFLSPQVRPASVPSQSASPHVTLSLRTPCPSARACHRPPRSRDVTSVLVVSELCGDPTGRT